MLWISELDILLMEIFRLGVLYQYLRFLLLFWVSVDALFEWGRIGRADIGKIFRNAGEDMIIEAIALLHRCILILALAMIIINLILKVICVLAGDGATSIPLLNLIIKEIRAVKSSKNDNFE